MAMQPQTDERSPSPLPEPPKRAPARASARVPERMYLPPEPHEKYYIPPEDHPPGMDLQWLPTRIAGQPNPEIGKFYRAGWQPARAHEFPRLSGYGTEYPPEMIERGLLKNAEADGLVELDDQMLIMRPKELSARAQKQREAAAVNQVEVQMRRLQQVSSQYRGTRLQRRHAPMPDTADGEE